MSDYILEMRNISKEFPGVKALDNVNLKVRKGEIHALVGENGAGKSTLMKVLSGVYPYGTYCGDIVINGEIRSFHGVKDSEKAGISIIYQELALVKYMNVCENIFLGSEIKKNKVIDWEESFAQTTKLLNDVRLDISPETKVVNLGIGQQQLVEIAKAISKETDILIFDEPTAALTESETENLLRLLNEFRQKGLTCIYISHKLNEVFSIADRITVLRDGKTIATHDTKELNEDQLIYLMVGRELTQRFPRVTRTPGEVVMEVEGWTVFDPEIPNKKAIDNVSFSVRKGEILGIAGMMGAGRTELAMSIFGCYGCKICGDLKINNKKQKDRNPRKAISKGVCYLSEDRKQFGLVLGMDIMNNISLSSMNRITKFGVINQNEEIKSVEKLVSELYIKTPSIEQKVVNLSGGNQQKVVLAKWLRINPKVLILDEPTRGIDIGAKYEIYNIMNALAAEGVSIILISSELPEVLGMSDRILVMHEGRISGELPWEEATQEKVISYAIGGQPNNE